VSAALPHEVAAAAPGTGPLSLLERIPWAALLDLLLLASTVAIADAGLATEADGAVAALVFSVLRPRLRPYLLLVVAGFQDAKGLSGYLWYGGTLALGGITLLANGAWLPQAMRQGRRDFRELAVLALALILYAIVSSYVQRWFGIHEQAITREPIVVGLLEVAMLLIGVALWETVSADPRAGSRIGMVLWLMFLNGMAVSIARMYLGTDKFVSAAGIQGMDEGGEQLFEDTPLGFPRLTGTYLTPIGFAMYIGYLLILWEAVKRQQRVRWTFVTLYCAVGIAMALASLSKDMAIFFVLTSLAFATVRRRLAIPVLLLFGGLVAAGVAYIGLEGILDAFRFESGTSDESYRAVAWLAVVQSFNWTDWVFGTGIAYWPVFLERTVGFSLSDPHTWVLSIPGTYGLIGVAFYALLGLFLFNSVRQTSGYLRSVAIGLACMFFIVDASSIPYVIGNTPITMMIWAALAALGMRRFEPGGPRARG